MNYHLEEHYGIPLETPVKRNPSKELRKRILRIYNRTCFGCGVTDADEELNIDHIYPQSKGGDTAFRNLQSLCKDCGDLKRDDLPEEIDVYLDLKPV